MKSFRIVTVVVALFVTLPLYSQQTTQVDLFQDFSRLDAALCSGQDLIFLEPNSGNLITATVIDRDIVNAYVSMDNGATWVKSEYIDGTPDEVRSITVSGTSMYPIVAYSNRGSTPGEPPWARHLPYVAQDDFGWGGGAFTPQAIRTSGTEDDVLDAYYLSYDISPFNQDLRGVVALHGSSQAGGEYYQFFASVDGGATWSDRLRIISAAASDSGKGLYVDDLTSNSTPDFMYGPDNSILCAGRAVIESATHDYYRLWYITSDDAGTTWSDVKLIPGTEELNVSNRNIDRAYKVILDAEDNFHVFAIAADTSGVWAAYDFKMADGTWTSQIIAEPQLLEDGLVAAESDWGDAGPLCAPTLNSDGVLFFSYIDVVDTTGGMNDYRLFATYSKDNSMTWSGPVQVLDDPEFNAIEFTDVARSANGNLHVIYCTEDTSAGSVTQWYAQVPTASLMKGEAQVIPVEAGTNQISAAFASANAGDILELVTDGGQYIEEDSLVVDKPITIRAAAELEHRPVWKTTDSTQCIYLKSDIAVQGINFDGGDMTDAAIRSVTDDPKPNKFSFDRCNLGHFTGDILDAASAITVDTVIVTNCVLHSSGDEGIELSGDRSGDYGPVKPGVHFLKVENCTFYDLVGDGIKVYAKTAGNDPGIAVVNHVTINGGERGIYFRSLAEGTVVTNSIITNSGTGVRMRDSFQLAVPNSDVWNNGEDYQNDAVAGDGTISADPMFVDPANGNFDLLTSSPCIGTAGDGQNMGDTNWGISTEVASRGSALPGDYDLSQNYPNPFNNSTVIEFAVAQQSRVKLAIYNLLGEEIATLTDKLMTAGQHRLVWDGTNDQGQSAPSGIYMVKMQSGDFTQSKKLILIK